MSSDDPNKPDDPKQHHEEKAADADQKTAGDQKAAGAADAPVEPITLDRYLSKRRPVQKAGWLQIISMVAMLGALVMIMMYKDSCGRQVSQLVGNVAPGPGSVAPKVVPPRPRAPVLPPTLSRPSPPPSPPPPSDPKPAK